MRRNYDIVFSFSRWIYDIVTNWFSSNRIIKSNFLTNDYLYFLIFNSLFVYKKKISAFYV